MLKDEFEIIRALSVKLSEDKILVVTYQYHTEKSETDPAGKKNDRSKSRYRMLARVDTVENLEKAVREFHSDELRTKPWIWPDDPSWNGRILYMKDSSNEGRSNWLRLKLKKAVSREEGLLLMKGYKKNVKLARTAARSGKKIDPAQLYSVYTPNAVYDVKGYTCADGSVVDLDDFDSLLEKTGQNLCKEIKMKLVGPGSSPSQGRKKKNQAQTCSEHAAEEPEIVTTD